MDNSTSGRVQKNNKQKSNRSNILTKLKKLYFKTGERETKKLGYGDGSIHRMLNNKGLHSVLAGRLEAVKGRAQWDW